MFVCETGSFKLVLGGLILLIRQIQFQFEFIEGQISMGITKSAITQSEFKKFWRVGDSIDHLVLWENKDNPTNLLEQYTIRNDESQHFQQLFHLRRNNPYIVNAYALQKDGMACNVDQDTEHIFIERIRLRLSNIQDVPYPSILHIYDAAIHGYAQLSSLVGFFPVDQDQIGINDRGQVKVWLNTAFQSSHVAKVQNMTEPFMLQSIFQIVESVVDNSTYPPGQPTLRQHLSQPTPSITFLEASHKFVNYMRLYFNSEVPANMFCVSEVGGTEMINEWCRGHQSYGFQLHSLRVSEKLWHTRHSKITPPKQSNQNEANNSTLQNEPNPSGRQVQRVGLGLPVIREAQNESRTFAQQSVNRHADFIVQASPRAAVQPFNQQLIPLNINQGFVPRTEHKFNRIELSPRMNTPDGLPHRQTPASAPANFAWIPPAQTVIPSPRYNQQHQTVIGNDRLPVSSRAGSTLHNQSSATAPLQQSKQYAVFPVDMSRLQQQRVISQTIEIKETSPENKVYKAEPPLPVQEYSKSVQSATLNWQFDTQKTNYLDQDHSYLNNYTNSTTLDRKAFSPDQDGKSSPQFLALIGQLRSGQAASNTDRQIHAQSSFTHREDQIPVRNWEVRPAQAYEANAREVYSQQAFSGKQQDSPRRINSGLNQESNLTGYQSDLMGIRNEGSSSEYVYSKYEAIDPELLADLRQYGQ